MPRSISMKQLKCFWLAAGIFFAACGDQASEVPSTMADSTSATKSRGNTNTPSSNTGATATTTVTPTNTMRIRPGVLSFETEQRVDSAGVSYLGVNVFNDGDGPLTIIRAPDLTEGDGTIFALSAESFPLVLKAQEGLTLKVRHETRLCGKHDAKLRVVTSPKGSMKEEGKLENTSELVWQQEGVMLLADRLDFGKVKVGTMSQLYVDVMNCDETTVSLDSVGLEASSELKPFQISLSELGPLYTNERKRLAVSYKPVDKTNDQVQLQVQVGESQRSISVFGRGVDTACSEAVALLDDFSLAVVGQEMKLDASKSKATAGRSISNYIWSVVEAPDAFQGAVTTSSKESPNATIVPDVVGDYKIALSLLDDQGVASCQEATVVFSVQELPPKGGLIVNLFWSNQEDLDKTDKIGSDLDLHLLKMGPGRWFERPYDVYFRAPMVSWEEETAYLNVDASDGSGPEQIVLNNAEECSWYAVGAHYFRQRFGTAKATVVVMDSSGVIYRTPVPAMLVDNGQFWDVLRIHWDGVRFRVFDFVEPYRMSELAPEGRAGDVTPEMKSSGLCTKQELY